MRRILGLLLVLLAAPASSQDAAALSRALGFSRGLIKEFSPSPLLSPEQQRAQSKAAAMLQQLQSSLPAPDAQTLAWLSKRVPGLDTANVRLVSFDVADQVMTHAAGGRLTWMDVLSDPLSRGVQIYYVPLSALNRIEAKYYTGLVPVRGKTEDNKPFQMQGFVGGQGKVHLLFDWSEFSYRDPDDGKRFRIDNGGRLTATIRGPGDVGIQGFSAYGAPVFCPWARISRMTKTSMYKVRVETSCATREADLHAVRAR